MSEARLANLEKAVEVMADLLDDMARRIHARDDHQRAYHECGMDECEKARRIFDAATRGELAPPAGRA